ncbi:MAG: helix-turn-helix transcriptional regulator [Clostridia bacterium]|nr:helix-turn-helix transcriptional regulator [Clostridia bacterium]
MSQQTPVNQLQEIARRIREMREILGYSEAQMAEKTDVSPEEYRAYEACEADLPFTFLHKCALAFGIELTELLEGHNALLTSYTVTRKGQGHQTAREDGISIQNLAPKFKHKLAEPYWVR